VIISYEFKTRPNREAFPKLVDYSGIIMCNP
jgi:hypothetical protein